MRSKLLLQRGVKINVIVTTKYDTILYPAVYEQEDSSLMLPDLMQIAADNYKLLSEGLNVTIDLKIEPYSSLSNSILAFYVIITVAGVYLYYKSYLKKIRLAEMTKSRQINRLQLLEKENTAKLDTLDHERQKLLAGLKRFTNDLEQEKTRADINETELIEEIVSLEKEIEENQTTQNELVEEIDLLKKQIQGVEKGKQKIKAEETSQKRFNTLYKNVYINDRAVSGFAKLTDDLKIKGEEIVHQLNENPGKVTVKRKVFMKKGNEKVFEVNFAYMGRLYFTNTRDNKIKILAIGTKNTQAKDLEFLSNI